MKSSCFQALTISLVLFWCHTSHAQEEPQSGTMYQLQVLDAETNRKLDGATITFAASDFSVRAVDRKTHYAASLGPGRYTVTASKAGYETRSGALTLDENPANWQSIVVRLPRVKKVEPRPERPVTPKYQLQVLDGATNRKLDGVSITFAASDFSVKAVDRKTHYEASVSAGRYTVTISKAGYTAQRVAITLDENPRNWQSVQLTLVRIKNAPQPERPVAPKYQLQVLDSTTRRKLDGVSITFRASDFSVKAVELKTHYEANVGPGRYTVTVSRDGYTSQSVSINLDENPAKWQSIQVTLERKKDVPPPERPAAPKYQLQVLDASTKRKLDGVSITFAASDFSVKAVELKTHYEAAVSSGRYTVTLSKEGYTTQRVAINLDQNPRNWRSISLSLVREKVEPPAVKPIVFWIKVLDDLSGKPIPAATVVLAAGDEPLKLSQTKEWHYAKLQPGTYNLSVSKAGYVSQRFTLALGAKPEDVRSVHLKRDQPAPPRGVAFPLRVIDDLDSKLLSGVRVSIKGLGKQGATVTAKEQRGGQVVNNYSAELTPGKYRITLSKPGYETETLDTSVTGEGRRDDIKPIRLKRVRKPPTLVTLSLRVVDDEGGAAIPGADVVITSGRVAQKVDTSKDLYFSRLKPGTYTAIVAKSGYSSQQLSIELGLETVSRTVKLKRVKTPSPPVALSLQLEVVDERGASIRNPTVVIAATGVRIAPKKSKGFHTSELKPGRYSVAVSKKGYTPQRLEVVIGNTDVKRQVTLKRASSPTPTPTPTPDPPKAKLSLTIVVVDSKGQAVERATVTMASPTTTAKFLESPGKYKASGLKTGLYDVTVSKVGYETEEIKASIGLTDGRRTVILKRIRPAEYVLRILARDENEKPVVSFESKADAGIVIDIAQQTTYLARLKPGRYEVRVEKQGYESQVHTVTIRSADERLDLQLQPVTEVTRTPDTPAIPLETQAAGITLQPGKNSIDAVKVQSKAGLLLRKHDSSKGSAVTQGKPGGLGLTVTQDEEKPNNTDDPADNGTLTISRQPQTTR